MDKSRNLKYYDDLDDQGQFEEFNRPERDRRVKKKNHESLAVAEFNQQFANAQDDSHEAVQFTYQAARFEAGWMKDTLAAYLEQKWISDVLAKIKIGKEANVYLCRSGEAVQTPLLAVKLYRPRMFRNLKNDCLYREGRSTLNEDGNIIRDLGMLKAEHNRTVYGEEVRLQSWIAHEFQSLRTLHAAGADVPQAYEMGASSVLMEYIGDEQTAAPTLNTVPLGSNEAQRLFDRMVENIRVMLAQDIVHADLSAYNILYWDGAMRMIDLPQAVSPKDNRNAWQIFHRDVRRVGEYFARQGVQVDSARLAAQLWRAAGHSIRPEADPRLLDANDAADRRLYQVSREAE